MVYEDMVADQLVEKDRMKVEMSRIDPDLIQYVYSTNIKVKPKVTLISGSYQKINDTFIIDHPYNCIMYDPTESKAIDDMEDSADWSTQGAVTITIANEATILLVGSASMKCTWSDTSGNAIVQSITSYGDLSAITGAASGTPAQGKMGIWIYCTSTSIISALALRIGSSSIAYKEYNASWFQESAFTLYEGWNLALFDLDNPDATAGTADWTAVDFIQLRFTVAAAGSIYFDYFTGSKNNNISMCGMGDRRTRQAAFTKTTLL